MTQASQELINAQLQLKGSVKEYLARVFSSDYPTYMPYWRLIPEYIISRCPLCLEPYIQQVDTYSLITWGIQHNMNSIKYGYKEYQRCDHFVGVHTFLNLNGEKPRNDEFEYSDLYSTEPEVPMVTPTLLPVEVESYVVLHSLPICRIVEEQFVPKYVLYLLTYYAVDRSVPILRRRDEWTDGHDLPTGYMIHGYARLGIYWEETESKPEAWDLKYWIDKGKLQWLDLTDPELSLTNKKEEFPYANIEGVRHGYRYKDGQYEVVYTRPTIKEYKAHLKKQYPDLEF